MTRRELLRLGLLVGSGALLAACQAGTPPAASSTAPTPLTPATSSAAGATAAASVPSQGPTPLSPRIELKVQDGGIASLAGMYVALDRGYYAEEGLQLTLVPGSGAQGDVLPAAVSGAIDVASLAPGAAHFNAVTRGIVIPAVVSLQVITSEDRSGGLVIRKDLVDSGKLTTYADLHGIKIGVLGVNSTSQYLCELALARGGFSRKDVEFVNLDSPAQVVALSTRALDAVYTFEPYVTQAAAQGIGVLQFPRGEYGGGTAGNMVVISPLLFNSHPEAIEHYVVATLRGLRDYHNALFRNQGDRNGVIGSLAAHTAIKDPAVYASIALSTVDRNGELDIASLQRVADYLLANGAITDRVDAASAVNRTYLDAALSRLGRVSA